MIRISQGNSLADMLLDLRVQSTEPVTGGFFLHRLSAPGATYVLTGLQRARVRLPQAHFAAADLFRQPWGEERHRFDLVTACEVLYYLSDPAATIARMRHLGRAGLVTFFAPACGRVGPHVEAIPGLQKTWIHHGGTAWLIGWWRDE